MKFLSVCSGIEAASVAWAPLGWKAWAFSEIEPFPCALLAHHYPDVPNFGDMTKYQEWPIPDEPIDLLCGGTPCQSFSVAGLRKGLDDPRGNLMLTYLAIARKYRPRWLVWENVPGVLSSNGGRDFGAFLWALGQCGYGWAYRILDAQYFGVAQRRRRVFVVAYLGSWQRAAAVLFERHSLQGHPAPRRETGQRPTGTIAARTQGGGGLGTDFDCDGGLVPDIIAGTLSTAGAKSRGAGADTAYLCPDIVSQAMSAKWAKGTAGPAGPAGDEHHNLLAVPAVTHSLRGDGFDASQDGTGRGTPLVVDTLTSNGDAYSGFRDEKGLVAISFHENQRGELTTNDTAGSLKTSGGKPGQGYPAIAIQGTMINRSDTAGPAGSGIDDSGLSFTLTKNDQHAVQTAMQVRRLTPRECERLQGFPDDYTLIPHRNKPAADGPRYKALGNSWAVPCARWIGDRIAAVDAITELKQSEAA